MKTKTNIKSGAMSANHNETLARASTRRSLKVKTSVKGGLLGHNQNETLVRSHASR